MKKTIKVFCIITAILLGVITNIGCGGVEWIYLYLTKKMGEATNYALGIDNTKPVIVSLEPKDQSQEVSPELSKLIIKFDKPMDKDCFNLTQKGKNIPYIVNSPEFDLERKEFSVNVKLLPNTEYKIGINTSKSSEICKFKDTSDNILKELVWTFRTSPSASNVTQKIDSDSQRNGSDLQKIKEKLKSSIVSKCKDAARLFIELGEEKAIEKILDANGPYFKKDSYIYILCLDGTMKAHPVNPILNNKPVIDFSDINGKRFIFELIKIAKSDGSGWVDYLWPKPKEKFPSKKNVYIYRVPETDFAVCSGIYLD